MEFIVHDLDCARELKARRLLTSSLRHEPSFKQDEMDVVLASASATKKARFLSKFNFEQLLPLRQTLEEAMMSLELGLIVLQPLPSKKSFICKLKQQKQGEEEEGEIDPVLLSSAKFPTFKTLWERGFTMVDGLKFGVDYLAYSKDPLLHHADYMILIECELNSSPVDLVALATVAGKAKKELLIATKSSLTTSGVEFTKLVRRHVNLKRRRGGNKAR